MPYNSVIWDWNGTLLDDLELAVSTMNVLLRDHGLNLLETGRYLQIFDFPVQQYYERAGFDLSAVDFPALSTRFCTDFETAIDQAQLFEATHTVLGDLQGHRQFVLSNTEQGALLRMLDRFGVAGHFDAVCGLAHDRATGKVEVGEQMLDAHQVERRSGILIGDTTHDADVAQALGLDCLLVASGHHGRDRLQATGLPVVDSLAEAGRYIVAAE